MASRADLGIRSLVHVRQAHLRVVGDGQHSGNTLCSGFRQVSFRVAANKPYQGDNAVVDTDCNVGRIYLRIPAEFIFTWRLMSLSDLMG